MSQNNVACPGCGLMLPLDAARTVPPPEPYNAAPGCLSLYQEVVANTWGYDTFFIHQYVVDTYAASHVGEEMKPIGIFFALAGVYLAAEKGLTGRQVQRAHMAMAIRPKNAPAKPWPLFTPPAREATLTVDDVLAAPPGQERDDRIKAWSRAVWETWADEHERIRALTREYLETEK